MIIFERFFSPVVNHRPDEYTDGRKSIYVIFEFPYLNTIQEFLEGQYVMACVYKAQGR